ncbi:DUF1217 domain-containing protein [Shimia sp. SK013]|uniref:DUF1217 domain-containing protein n=1 Tax=Shimia sp. SK013 TaxID=1389006 RepID=UPI001F4CC4FD|nr:DUF1217 domain-containing protein [Shimia sp. SK013]
MDTQTAAFEKSPEIVSDTEYFAANIGEIDSAEELVNDFRLLKVALGAYGLDDDVYNKFFVQKILDEGTLTTDALANKLTDTKYKEMSADFGFGDFSTPSTKLSTFAGEIIEKYNERQFEISVGQQDANMRLALNLERELSIIANNDASPDTMWFSVLGSEPLRTVFETALGLPENFASLDLDRQVEELRSRVQNFMGDGEITQFSDPENLEKLNQRFLLMSQMQSFGVQSSGQIALTLLQY